jgi:hypothetical protein
MYNHSSIIGILLIAFIGCTSKNGAPSVSQVHVNLKIQRFEQDLFAIDTNHVKEGLTTLEKKHPAFLPLYIGNVLGLGPITDSNELAFTGTKLYLMLNRKPFEKAKLLYKNFDDTKNQLTSSFQYTRYYFPDYPVPKIITTVGPLDGLAPMSNGEPSPNFIGNDFLAIGLQFYLGKDFEIYNDPDYISQIAPLYRSRRFSKEYIVADVMKLVVDDLYPDSSSRLAFSDQLIERGKRAWLLKKLLPETHDTIILGYTGQQLAWAEKNEKSIYNYFTQNGLLYERDPILVRPYLTDGPFTRELGEESPGNIGLFIGLRIVESYERKQKSTDVKMVMRTPAQQILNESRYKPK